MDTPFVRRAYNLGLKTVANFADVLTEAQVEYYEQHLGEIPSAIRRGFILPGQEISSTIESVGRPVVVTPTLFKATDTDLDWWIEQAQMFAKEHLGVDVDLRKRFAIPTELPWRSVIPVFTPAGFSNRDVITRLTNSLKLEVWEEVDVMNYSSSEANTTPTLHLIENSVRPNDDTMNLRPNQLVKTGKPYLDLRGYGLAFGLYHFAKKEYLDPETFTWFPDSRLSTGEVADGYWLPDDRKVRFNWSGPDHRYPLGGARVAIPVPLRK